VSHICFHEVRVDFVSCNILNAVICLRGEIMMMRDGDWMRMQNLNQIVRRCCLQFCDGLMALCSSSRTVLILTLLVFLSLVNSRTSRTNRSA
jgi:hypothetical protein